MLCLVNPRDDSRNKRYQWMRSINDNYKKSLLINGKDMEKSANWELRPGTVCVFIVISVPISYNNKHK